MGKRVKPGCLVTLFLGACLSDWYGGALGGVAGDACLPGDVGPQPGDPTTACGRWVGVAPDRVERWSGAAEAAAGAAERPRCLDQRLVYGAEFRRGRRPDGFYAHWHLIPRRHGDYGEAGVLNIAGQGSSQ